jgi:hypothetical protein
VERPGVFRSENPKGTERKVRVFSAWPGCWNSPPGRREHLKYLCIMKTNKVAVVLHGEAASVSRSRNSSCKQNFLCIEEVHRDNEDQRGGGAARKVLEPPVLSQTLSSRGDVMKPKLPLGGWGWWGSLEW